MNTSPQTQADLSSLRFCCQREQMHYGPSLCWTWAAGPGQLTSECPCVKKNLLTFLLSGLAFVAKCLKYLGPKSGWWWRKMSTIWVTTQRACCGISRGSRRRCNTMRRRFLVCLFLVSTHGLNPRMSSWPCQLVKNKLLNGALFDLWPPRFVWEQRRSNTL